MPMLYKISRDSLPALMPDPGGLDQMYTCGNPGETNGKTNELVGHEIARTHAHAKKTLDFMCAPFAATGPRYTVFGHHVLVTSVSGDCPARDVVACACQALVYQTDGRSSSWVAPHLAPVVLPDQVLAQRRLLVPFHVHEVG